VQYRGAPSGPVGHTDKFSFGTERVVKGQFTIPRRLPEGRYVIVCTVEDFTKYTPAAEGVMPVPVICWCEPIIVDVAEDDGKTAWGPASGGLQCRLLPLEQTVEVAEGTEPENIEVYVTYELRNVGDGPVTFLPWHTPLEGDLGKIFRVLGSDGAEVDFWGEQAQRLPATKKQFIRIDPGQVLLRRLHLPYDFTERGLYQVSFATTRTGVPTGTSYIAGYYGGDAEKAKQNPDNVWTGTLQSNTVTVNVVRPGVQPAAHAARKFSLSIRPDVAQIVPYEPLRATVTLRNESSEPARVDAGWVTTLQFFCASDGGAFRPCGHGAQMGKSLVGTREIAPGKAVASAEMLFLLTEHGGYSFVFDKPGKYRLKVRAELDAGVPLESDVVNVLVNPLPSEHVDAVKLVTGIGAARMLQGWERKQDGAAVLARLIAEFPRCPYADHARYTLGGYLASKHFSREDGDIRSAKKAFEHFSAVSVRISATRTRAVLRMAYLAHECLEVRHVVDIQLLMGELERCDTVAETIGLGETVADLREKLGSLPEASGERIPWGPVSNGLQSRLLPLQQTVEVAEGAKPEDIEVYVTYELRNVGEKPARFLTYYPPLWGLPVRDLLPGSVFRFIGPGGEAARYWEAVIEPPLPPGEADFRTVKPGEVLSQRVRLKYEFSQPWRYQVSIATAHEFDAIKWYYDSDLENARQNPDNVWTGTLTSNTVTVNVVRAGESPASGTPEEQPAKAPATAEEVAAQLFALRDASRRGEIGKVQALLDARPELVNARDRLGRTALHHAARSGQKAVAELLLDRGTEVSARDSRGETPLYRAVRGGHTETVRLLLARGANWGTPDLRGATPLHLAALTGQIGALEAFLESGADLEARAPGEEHQTMLHLAAEGGKHGVVELLLAKGASVSARDDEGMTALHWAARNGHKGVGELLLAGGADANARDEHGYTPLHVATSRGRRDVAELLLANGADVNAKDVKGKTPIAMAEQDGHKELVELLRQHGAKE